MTLLPILNMSYLGAPAAQRLPIRRQVSRLIMGGVDH